MAGCGCWAAYMEALLAATEEVEGPQNCKCNNMERNEKLGAEE